MLIFLVASALLGVVLACFFRAYILLPTCAVLIGLVVANPSGEALSVVGAFVAIALLVTSLQLGFLSCLLFKTVSRVRVSSDAIRACSVAPARRPVANQASANYRRIRH